MRLCLEKEGNRDRMEHNLQSGFRVELLSSFIAFLLARCLPQQVTATNQSQS